MVCQHSWVNVIIILAEEQQWLVIWLHAFPKGIRLKVNVIVRLEFELIYCNVTDQLVSHYTTENFPHKYWPLSSRCVVKTKNHRSVYHKTKCIHTHTYTYTQIYTHTYATTTTTHTYTPHIYIYIYMWMSMYMLPTMRVEHFHEGITCCHLRQWKMIHKRLKSLRLRWDFWWMCSNISDM